MAFEQQDNSGSLFLEPKKFTSPKDGKEYESYGGSAKIDGKEYWINAFLNTTREGKKLYNIKFKPKINKGLANAIDRMF